jgi:hypothetical protein
MGFGLLTARFIPNPRRYRPYTQRRPERTAQAVAGDLWVLD